MAAAAIAVLVDPAGTMRLYRDASPFFTFLMAVLGAVASLVAASMARRSARARVTRAPVEELTLADRIEALRANLSQSSTLMDEINAELHLRVAALDRLQAEAEENQRLAALHKEEADAVRDLVAATVESAHEKTTGLSKRQQWLFFLAGLLASVPVGVVANFVYEWLAA